MSASYTVPGGDYIPPAHPKIKELCVKAEKKADGTKDQGIVRDFTSIAEMIARNNNGYGKSPEEVINILLAYLFLGNASAIRKYMKEAQDVDKDQSKSFYDPYNKTKGTVSERHIRPTKFI